MATAAGAAVEATGAAIATGLRRPTTAVGGATPVRDPARTPPGGTDTTEGLSSLIWGGLWGLTPCFHSELPLSPSLVSCCNRTCKKRKKTGAQFASPELVPFGIPFFVIVVFVCPSIVHWPRRLLSRSSQPENKALCVLSLSVLWHPFRGKYVCLLALLGGFHSSHQ